MEQIERVLNVLNPLLQAVGVSGAEDPVAQVIAGQLTAIGKEGSELHRDHLGNRWVHFGPEGEPERLLVAHMDEIGLRVTSLRPDGQLCVAANGGIDPQLWEGTPVFVHTASGPVAGAVAPVSLHITDRQGQGPKGRLSIQEVFVDIGAENADQAAELGVRVPDSVTWPKLINKLAGGKLQARSLDDRFGCAALVLLAESLVVNPPEVPTVLAWSVQEEVGLRGARRLAVEFPHCKEVVAVDSYTVGQGPRDNRQFDGPVLGGGPVLRSLDSTTIVPDLARRELLAKLEALCPGLQVGYMPGGNDASVFEATGALVYGLGVAVQYSHSQAERIAVADLSALVGLLVGLCALKAPLAG